MRLKTPESVGITPIMEKKARLEALFRDYLDRLPDNPAAPTAATVLLLAQSLDSPAAMAVENLVFLKSQRPVAVRMILTRLETPFANADTAPVMRTGVTCRVLRDNRFLEAHEQVVLSDRAVWIGDSMRRDPAKRDAPEAFFANDARAAAYATSSFERLWTLAKPIRTRDLNAKIQDTAALDAPAAAQIAAADLGMQPDTAPRR